MHFIVADDTCANGVSMREGECRLKRVDKSSEPFVVHNAEGLL